MLTARDRARLILRASVSDIPLVELIAQEIELAERRGAAAALAGWIEHTGEQNQPPNDAQAQLVSPPHGSDVPLVEAPGIARTGDSGRLTAPSDAIERRDHVQQSQKANS